MPNLADILSTGRCIALAGPSASGKTAIATEIAYRYGYRATSLASPIKALAAQYVPNADKRQAHQHIGESFRDLAPDVWLDYLHERVGGPTVVDDLRTFREQDYLRRKGWVIVRVMADVSVMRERQTKRDGAPMPIARALHPTEIEAASILGDAILDNNGTMRETLGLLESLHVHAWHESGASLVPESREYNCGGLRQTVAAHSLVTFSCDECGEKRDEWREAKVPA